MNAAFTDCGLPGITRIPYGVHMCHFFERREELASALVPYFAAGLRARERCIWITSDPLGAADARTELSRSGTDARAAEAAGALILRDFSDWYAEAGALRGTDVVRLWLDEERRALEAGYRGLRITGNTSFLTPATWDFFMEYEAAVTAAFRGRRIVTLCSYRSSGCGASGILDVARRHTCALERPGAGWRILDSQ